MFNNQSSIQTIRNWEKIGEFDQKFKKFKFKKRVSKCEIFWFTRKYPSPHHHSNNTAEISLNKSGTPMAYTTTEDRRSTAGKTNSEMLCLALMTSPFLSNIVLQFIVVGLEDYSRFFP